MLAAAGSPAAAQRIRVRSTTTAQYVQLEPITLDSTGNFTSAGVQSATPIIQDIELSAWDLGVSGLRGYGLFRMRGALGSELVWPRSADHFDALDVYLRLDRPTWQATLGRQQRVSSLGIYTFDGAGGAWHPSSLVRVEGFLGRGLARGYLEPLSDDEIRALDPTRPNQGTILVGATGWVAPWRGWSVSGSYQREALTQGSGIVSERASLDAAGPISAHLTASGSLERDIAAGTFGKAKLGLTWQSRIGSFHAEAFRYRPVFDLTTIWGVFSPEPNNGFRASAEVPVGHGIVATGGFTERFYRPATDNTPFLFGVSNQSTTTTLGARWTGDALSIDAQWHVLGGYGGYENGGDVRLGWARPGARWRAGLTATAFQQDAEFRVAEGTVYGLGGDADARINRRLRVRAQLARYWHNPDKGQVTLNWSQTRGLLSVEWTLGASADHVGGWK